MIIRHNVSLLGASAPGFHLSPPAQQIFPCCTPPPVTVGRREAEPKHAKRADFRFLKFCGTTFVKIGDSLGKPVSCYCETNTDFAQGKIAGHLPMISEHSLHCERQDVRCLLWRRDFEECRQFLLVWRTLQAASHIFHTKHLVLLESACATEDWLRASRDRKDRVERRYPRYPLLLLPAE